MQPGMYPAPRLYAALLQLPWIFHCEPFLNVSSDDPNVQAHLSAFSEPALSNHAFSCGSVSISLSSCPVTFASAFKPWLCGAELCGSQPGSLSRLKKNANCTGTPPI